MPLRKLMIELGVMAGVALIFALLGPFGTSAFPLTERALRWLLFAVGGYTFFRPLIAGGNALGAQAALSTWLTTGTACIVAAMPTTVLVAWSIAGAEFGQVNISFLADLYPKVLLAGAIVTAVQFSIRKEERSDAQEDPVSVSPSPATVHREAEPVRQNALFDLLPSSMGRDLLYLENEDHYVRVHTALGNTLVLMRMRDAAAALDGFDGIRVHRGWWVARGAVSETIRRDRSVLLRLRDGREVPVARSAIPSLRAAGWL